MTLYMLFAGLGILICMALVEAAVSGFSSAHLAFGLQFGFFAVECSLRRRPLLRESSPAGALRPALAERANRFV